MSIKLVSTGGGSVTIQEPNTASDFTLSVPAQTANLLTNRTAGTILQVVTDKKTNDFSTSSQNVFVTTNQSLSITPSSTSSRILIMFNAGSVVTTTANTAITVEVRRSGTQYAKGAYYTATVSGNQTVPFGVIHGIDSPNTTSSITYEVFAAEGGVAGTVTLSADRVLTLMEIAG
jgi:hypothetical protein